MGARGPRSSYVWPEEPETWTEIAVAEATDEGQKRQFKNIKGAFSWRNQRLYNGLYALDLRVEEGIILGYMRPKLKNDTKGKYDWADRELNQWWDVPGAQKPYKPVIRNARAVFYCWKGRDSLRKELKLKFRELDGRLQACITTSAKSTVNRVRKAKFEEKLKEEAPIVKRLAPLKDGVKIPKNSEWLETRVARVWHTKHLSEVPEFSRTEPIARIPEPAEKALDELISRKPQEPAPSEQPHVSPEQPHVSPEQEALELAGKLRMDLIPPEWLIAQARVMTYGATKHGPWDWTRPRTWMPHIGAAMRHMMSWWMGQTYDSETGIHNLAHAAVRLLMLVYLQEKGIGTDNRSQERMGV